MKEGVGYRSNTPYVSVWEAALHTADVEKCAIEAVIEFFIKMSRLLPEGPGWIREKRSYIDHCDWISSREKEEEETYVRPRILGRGIGNSATRCA